MATLQIRPRHAYLGRALAAVALLAVLAVSEFKGPAWTAQLRGLFAPDDASVAQSEQWVDANLPVDARIIADSAVMADLARTGTPAWDLLDYRKLDAQRSAAVAGNWRVYDFVVSTPAMRRGVDPAGQTRVAIASSTVVASFGVGGGRVEVREVDARGPDAAAGRTAAAEQASSEAGRQLLTSRSIRLSPDAAQQVVSGDVDGRLLSTLVGLSGQHSLTVGSFTDPDAGGLFPNRLRQVSVLVVDGVLVQDQSPQVTSVTNWLAAQTDPFRPGAVAVHGNELLIRFRLPGPNEAGVL
jgi:hypothetical protein